MNKTLLAISLIGALFVAGGLYKAINSDSELYSEETKAAFESFKSTQKRAYSSASEESFRLSVFDSNFNLIKSHNSQNLGWTMAVNQFADLTQDEFNRQMKGFAKPQMRTNPGSFTNTAPDSQDWSSKGAVTAVKNQGSCGSCWAFSATGGMEGGYFLKTGKLTSLSEQQLVSCDKKSGGNQGCNGGLPEWAFDYAVDAGMMTESDYPYKGMWSFGCKYSKSKVISDFKMTGHTTVPAADSDSLKAAVALSPVSIGIDAAGMGFQFYFGGIMSGSCGTSLDHGVLIVGYGEDNGKKFWKIKNSWGGSWGESGYFRITRKDGKGVGQCGLTEDATVPTF